MSFVKKLGVVFAAALAVCVPTLSVSSAHAATGPFYYNQKIVVGSSTSYISWVSSDRNAAQAKFGTSTKCFSAYSTSSIGTATLYTSSTTKRTVYVKSCTSTSTSTKSDPFATSGDSTTGFRP